MAVRDQPPRRDRRAARGRVRDHRAAPRRCGRRCDEARRAGRARARWPPRSPLGRLRRRARQAAVSVPTVAAARVFSLGRLRPGGRRSRAGQPTTMSFTVRQPDGAAADPLQDRRGAPHRRAPDHRPRRSRLHHPRPSADQPQRAADASASPSRRPGPYRVLVDIYPNLPGGQPNFQLFRSRQRGRRLPPPAAAALPGPPDRRRLPLRRPGPPGRCTRSRPPSSTSTSPTRTARPVHFTPWFGALAHAIFFHVGLTGLLPHARVRRRRAQLLEPARRRRASPATRRRRARSPWGSCSPSAAPGGCFCRCASTAAS